MYKFNSKETYKTNVPEGCIGLNIVLESRKEMSGIMHQEHRPYHLLNNVILPRKLKVYIIKPISKW